MSDDKELTVQSLGDAVRDKVRKAMMDALPDEVIQKLIQAEFKDFFDRKTGYRSDEPTLFQKMVQAEIHRQVDASVKARIAELLREHQAGWGPDGVTLLGPMVEACAPMALKAIIGNITGNILQQFRNQAGGV